MRSSQRLSKSPRPRLDKRVEPFKSSADGRTTESRAAVSDIEEKHFTIFYGDIGHTYESIMGPYLRGAKAVFIEDPYIRLPHQIQNFVRFSETCIRVGTIKAIQLVTGYDDKTQLSEISEKLEDLKQSLLEMDIVLDVKLNP